MARIQPPEWALHDSVWIGFPSAADLWLEDLEGAQAEVAAFANAVHADGAGETVRLVCANAQAQDAARDLAAPGVEIVAAPFFDIWLRDTAQTRRVLIARPAIGCWKVARLMWMARACA